MASPTPGPGGPKRMFGPTALFVTVFSLFVVGALGGGALRWATVRKESPAVPTTSAPVLPPSPFDLPSSAAEPTPTMSLAPVPTPTEHKKVDRQKQALDRLRRQAAKDSTDFPFDGRWAVQVASKYVGMIAPTDSRSLNLVTPSRPPTSGPNTAGSRAGWTRPTP